MRQVGNYALLAPLGQGGMGEVWRARHVRLDRPAAVKLVRPAALGAAGDPTVVTRRFEREARATSKLRSPHTVEVFDFGTTPEGDFWYAMELLEGLDLKTLVERHGPVSPARAVHFLRHACTSLAEAHAAGLLHRDIKPANLFASTLGIEHDVLKVLDFGLVKPTAPDDDAQLTSQLTEARSLPGSPAFMAPEAINHGPLDARADLYALGCVAWWLLTGELVFPGRGSTVKLLMAHLNDAPGAVGARAGQPIPPALEAIVQRLLAKDPGARFGDALALADALEAVPGPRWSQADARGWWAQHPLPAPPTVGPAGPMASADLEAAREAALSRLDQHFQRSQIAPGEFERRARAVALAEHPDALDALFSDLPGLAAEHPVPAVTAKPGLPARGASPAKRKWLVGIFGGAERKGGWQPAPETKCFALFGGIDLDFTQVELPPGETRIHAVAMFGGVEIKVPHHVPVVVDGVGIFGGFTQGGHKALPPPDGVPTPVIRVTGLALFGGVEVKIVDPAKPGGLFRKLLSDFFDD
ncbi:MAG: protein kinase [Myxococcales bacterium]|nr:protein kinase [Myxococcales bacterium]